MLVPEKRLCRSAQRLHQNALQAGSRRFESDPLHPVMKVCCMVCLHTMQRTTVKLPDDLDARLRHEAARRGTTISDLTREAIEAHLGVGNVRRLLAAGA